jgi:signal transduction histidine kinase
MRTDLENPLVGGARLVRADGRLAIEVRQPIVMPQPSDVLADQPLSSDASALSIPSAYAVVIVSVERIFKEMDALVGQSMLFWVLVLGVGLSVGWFVSGVMVSPLRQLAHSAQQWTIDGEEATPRPSPALAREDEVRSLWTSLTTMKRELDHKTAEIARLQDSVDDTVRTHTADLKEMNRRLSEVIALKNDLLLQVSHEVKTPLTGLSTLVSNLYDGVTGELSTCQKEYLARIMVITNQVTRLLTTLLEFAMAETGKIQLVTRPIALTTLAQTALDAFHPFQTERRVRCAIDQSMHGKRVLADPDRIQQVMLNLIHNAIKASSPGSTVVIAAREVGAEITISVQDSGTGIRPADRTTVLRQPLPAESRSHGGGVGLYICRYLVELHGGRIWFESEERKGTTFFFTLPVSQTPQPG